MMMTTQFFNQNQTNNQQNMLIKTQYPAKQARKQSITNNGGMALQNLNATMNIGSFMGSPTDNASGNHTAISGGRKPTADSYAYTM